MGEPLVVRPAYGYEIGQEDLAALADQLRADGIEARVGDTGLHRNLLPSIPFVEIVCLWLAQGAVEGLGGYAAVSAVKWAREQFRKKQDEGECVRVIELVRDEGEDHEGTVVKAIELSGADAEPVVISPKDFEDFTRTKSPYE